ncbi:hypothetical protein ADP64_000018 [Achromobacter phage phiAxp-2]|uniref:DUF7443 domain-containing protein n=1 Tax=Achromobacter phage phiAxp-2 TaxID=1664246 RepID=A0A0K2FIH4_9CAUD|nr:hypothetical protein ADP64_000018 [Achromobacter phage phiAxp-2]ALA45452.1 hypothetical protein ADP64_000018 [Achromobacter phage phiAxp-2]
MPKLIALAAITLVRDNERVTVKPGQAFDFTAEEVKDITKGQTPEVQLLRKPVNELADSKEGGDDDDTSSGAEDAKTSTKGTASKTGGRRGSANADL